MIGELQSKAISSQIGNVSAAPLIEHHAPAYHYQFVEHPEKDMEVAAPVQAQPVIYYPVHQPVLVMPAEMNPTGTLPKAASMMA